MSTRGLASATLLALAALIGSAACSSASDPTVIVVEAGTSTPSDAGPDPAVCGAFSDYIGCVSCCGYGGFLQADSKYQDCLCDDACKAPCTSTCAPGSDGIPTEACQTCIDSDAAKSTCVSKARAACAAIPSCAGFTACSVAAKCEDKPDEADAGP